LIFKFFRSQASIDRQETIELYQSVRRQFHNSSLVKPDAALELTQAIVLGVYQALKREFEVTPLAQAIYNAAHALIAYEGIFDFPETDFSKDLSYQAQWDLRIALREKERFLKDYERNLDLVWKYAYGAIGVVLLHLPPAAFSESGPDDITFEVRLLDLLDTPVAVVDSIQSVLLEEALVFGKIRKKLWDNVYRISGSTEKLLQPTQVRNQSEETIVDAYLDGTPLNDFLHTPLPFTLPFEARFSHCHVCAGSGSGKTQLLQYLITKDLERGFCVIDSQGDLIHNISHLRLDPERVILIDPTDIEYPPCLNMFDVNLARSIDPVERERILNGTIALYEYLFGGLLGAELTQKQGTIFGYIARLLLAIPQATIRTLIDVMEHGERYRASMQELQGTARRFFETQFFHKKFNATKDQILSRLYGVLGIATLDRMFSHEKNRIDLFRAMNEGKILLINTAADFLQPEGCSLFGRFFIAMILQAALQRSAIPEDRRRPYFVYIDEAYQYFDETIENLFNQARKYHVGLIIAHQFLGQMTQKLEEAVMASASIKIVSGLNPHDVSAFSKAMRCEPAFLEGLKKQERVSGEFACSVRNVTPSAIKITVPFGVMEQLPKTNEEEYQAMIEENRRQYCERVATSAASSEQRKTRPSSAHSAPQATPEEPQTKPAVRTEPIAESSKAAGTSQAAEEPPKTPLPAKEVPRIDRIRPYTKEEPENFFE
jgi:hypothetical protein